MILQELFQSVSLFLSCKRLHKFSITIIVLTLSTFITTPVLADEPRFDAEHLFGAHQNRTDSIKLGDMDGDGDLDIVVGNYGQNHIYFNDGVGNFSASGNSRDFGKDAGDTRSIALGDMNGDGALDIVAGNEGQQNVVYFNDGIGSFSETEESLNFGTGIDNTESVAVGDMDGDGDLDIVVGNYGQNHIYINDGIGNFTGVGESQSFGTAIDNTESVALGDMDGDGDLDIVAGHFGQNHVYINDGIGNFSEAENSRDFGTGNDHTESVALGDMDGDGDLDIVAGNHGQNYIYFNDGIGNFTGVGESQSFGTAIDNTESIALGDMDGDGDLDIVVGYSGQDILYLNNGLGRFDNPDDSPNYSTREDNTESVALGDMDGDGDLDIVVGNWRQKNVVYFSNGEGSFSGLGNSRGFGIPDTSVQSIALGDIDKDGNLDIVAGYSGKDLIYLNDGIGNFSSPEDSQRFGEDGDVTRSIALGDIDGDGDLDIVAGNYGQQNVVYLNDGRGNFTEVGDGHNFGIGDDKTWTVTLGDMDGDGALDIIAGNREQQNVVYLNDGIGDFTGVDNSRNFGTGDDDTKSLAIGDMDGDGDLDIVTGNWDENVIYLNDGEGNFVDADQRQKFGTGEDNTESVALGDMDGDGDLDIVIGNEAQQNVVYLNNGNGNFAGPDNSRFFGTGGDDTQSVVLGDVDGDGDLDIVAGNYGISNKGQQNVVYLNDSYSNFTRVGGSRDFGTGDDFTWSVALGDMDGDADLDIVAGNIEQRDVVIFNQIRRSTGLSNHPVSVRVKYPVSAAAAGFYYSSDIQAQRFITIPYSLFDPEGENVARVGVAYSMDGGGHWLPAVASTRTVTTNLTTDTVMNGGPSGDHLYVWDVWASGLLGQSDNVALRIVVYPQQSTTSPIAGTYNYTNTTSGPIQWPYSASTTLPFRVRGTQVRVIDESTVSKPVADALVYRLPSEQSRNAQPIGGVDLPFRTNGQGHLEGRGHVAVGDTLIALRPASLPLTLTRQISNTARLYHTSDIPGVTNSEPFIISKPGVQQIVISDDNLLLLFDLDVALEWDARQDAQFIAQLEFDIRVASEQLFDWSNGQVALGNVTVHHNARNLPEEDGFQPWKDAHIRIYATNRLRPNAAPGGIIRSTLTDTVKLTDLETMITTTETITFTTGQVRMPVVWNRYGESNGRLGEDWPHALAHELGHYLLFLEDNYIGLNEQGLLVTVPASDCPGAMNNPYGDVNSEFHPESGWLSGCSETLSHQEMGRSDWETIHSIYGMLKKPDVTIGSPELAGPNGLPLAVTELDYLPKEQGQAFAAPIFFLSEKGKAVQMGNSTRAILYPKNADRLIDLGRPNLDQIYAYGAQPGDRLCVYEPDANRLGCQEEIEAGKDQISLYRVENWHPEVRLSPVTSRTINISVESVIDGPLMASLYPVNDLESTTILLTKNDGVYSGTFQGLPDPALEGYIRVWVDGTTNPTLETIIDYSLGGNPIHLLNSSVHLLNRSIHLINSSVPAISSDGQVKLFGEQLQRKQGEEWIFTVQGASATPDAPPWLNVVGQAYWIIATDNAPDLNGASISFMYLGEDVPEGEEKEQFLQVYYREESEPEFCLLQKLPCWRPLHTKANTFYNIASAAVQGPGLYALMSSEDIKVEYTGWNLIGYPLHESQPVTQALASAEGIYQAVYGYDPMEDEDNPWFVYDVNLQPPFSPLVNRLEHLEPDRGYWLYVTEPITIYMTSHSHQPEVRAATVERKGIPDRPAIYYGWVGESSAGTTLFNVPITAEIDGVNCGDASVQIIDGKTAYIVYVKAADPADANQTCGAVGKDVEFKIGGQVVATQPWNNAGPQYFNLGGVPVGIPKPDINTAVYLPVITD